MRLQTKPRNRFSFAIILAVLFCLTVPLLSFSASLYETAYVFAEDELPDEGGGDPEPSDPDPGNPDPGNPDPGNPDPGNPDPGNPDPGNPDPGNPDPGNPDPGNPDPGNPEPPVINYKAEGFSIYYKDDGDIPLGATNGHQDYSDTIEISVKGKTVTFDTLTRWTDGARETYDSRNENSVTWSTSDPLIATVSPGGMVSPLKDGEVEISATLPGEYTQTGADYVAKVKIKIFGQSDGRYITAIRVVDATGRQITVHNSYVLEEDLSTAMVQFYAEVDVFDPKTQNTETISTKGEDGSYKKISEQASDLSDVYWNVGDSSMSAIESELGLFRPVKYGVSFFYAATRATFDNSELNTTAVVSALDPEGIGEESYNPQSSIRIKAYYELYKPDDLNGGTYDAEDAYVIDETYTIDEVEQMGVFTETYTALNNNSYYTMTGTGVGLSTLLAEAGVNLNGVNGLMFYAADSHMSGQFISYSYLFSPRYYYPNIYTGFAPYSEAKQVQPMLATVSNQIANGKTEPNYTMSEATRFRLLLGGRPDTSDTQLTIKWINTIIVELTGGPGTEFGDGDGDGDGTGDGDGDGDDDNNGNDTGKENENGDGDGPVTGDQNGNDNGAGNGNESGDGSDSGAGDGSGDSTGTGGVGGNTGEGDNNSSGDGVAGNLEGDGVTAGGRDGSGEVETSDLEIGTGAENDVETTIGIDAVDVPLAAGPAESTSSGKYNIYQVMNINDSDVPLSFGENPIKPYALPAAGSVLVLGGFSSFLWFRKELVMVALHPTGLDVSTMI